MDSPQRPEMSIMPVYLVSFLADVSLGTFAVAVVLLAEHLGANSWQIGVVGAGYGVSYCFSPYALGRLGDGRWGRRKSMLVSIAGFLLVQVFCLTLVVSWQLAFVGNLAAGVFVGLFWPSASSHASEVSGNAHDTVVTRFCTAWSVGYSFGPFMSSAFSEVSYVMAFAVVIAVASLILVVVGFHPVFKLGRQSSRQSSVSPAAVSPTAALPLAAVDLMAPPAGEAGEPAPAPPPPQAAPVLHPSPLERPPAELAKFQRIAVFAASFLFAFDNQTFLSLFPRYALNDGGLRLSPVLMGVLLLSFGVGRTVVFWFSGKIGPRHREVVLVAATGFIALTLVLVSTLTSFPGLLVVMSVYGVCTGFLFTVTLLFTLGFSEERKGKNTGILESTVGVGFMLSPLVGGYLMDLTGVLSVPWIFAALVTATLFLVLLRAYRNLAGAGFSSPAVGASTPSSPSRTA
ncbi:MAG: MFS transporter [Promethearchaeota archaeon]